VSGSDKRTSLLWQVEVKGFEVLIPGKVRAGATTLNLKTYRIITLKIKDSVATISMRRVLHFIIAMFSVVLASVVMLSVMIPNFGTCA
jgi:hypothetical protein